MVSARILRNSGVSAVLLAVAGCVLLHEAGHVIAAILCGGTVTDVTLLSERPNVKISGIFTPAQQVFQALAGSGMVLLFWLGARLSPRRLKHGLLMDTFSVLAFVELAGWALSAWFYPEGPHTNDAVRFLRVTHLQPAVIVASCAALASAGALLMLRQNRRRRARAVEARRALAAAAD